MNETLVLMLALLWAVVLLPGALRSRRSNTHVTVGGFHNAMAVLKKTPDGRSLMVPDDAGRIVSRGAPRHTSAQAAAPMRTPPRREDPRVARRRAIFTRLVVTVAATFFAAVIIGGFTWTLFTLSLATTGGYAALLRQLKRRQDQVAEVVRELRGDERADERHEERLPVAVGAAGPQVSTRPDQPWQPQSGVRIRRWNGE